MNIRVCFIALFSLAACALPTKAQEFIVTEGVVAAPVSAVWSAWTTTAGLKAWLAPHVDIDLRIDGLMRANYDPKGSLGDSGTIENRVLSFEPEQPTPDGKTMLRIVGLGFGSDEESQRMKDFFKQGNAFTLTQLQKHFVR